MSAHRMFRWIADVMGDANPFSVGFCEWSENQKVWYTLPTQLDAKLTILSPLRLSKESPVSEIPTMMEKGYDEPLAHTILREARSNENSNRRSALVMAISSVEIAIKQCVVSLSPDYSWFLENTQSPPVDKILKELVPTLRGVNKLGSRVPVLPKAARSQLKNAIELRNRLVHRPGTDDPTEDQVREALEVAKDILYLCDFYIGHDWALGNLNKSFRESLR